MAIFNLSLDDYSPHEKAGKYHESIYWCNKLIEKHPNIKIDLFVPAAYRRLGEKAHYLRNNLDWVEQVKQLPTKNYNICLHGFYHSRIDGKNPQSNNNELELLTYNETKTILDVIDEEFIAVGLKYKKIIRPPGFHIGEEAVKVFTDSGFIVAGDTKYYEKRKHIKNIKWISYNWDLTLPPPINDIIAYGHTSNWTQNYFNEDKYNLVLKLLSQREFEFKFIDEI